MENMIYWAIGIVLLVILTASVLMPTLKDANTTGWTTGEIAMWGIAGIVLVAVVIIAIVKGTKQ